MSILDLGNMAAVSAACIKPAPKITGITPFGSNILVELLNKQELTSDKIIISDAKSPVEGPPQAYVLAVGSGITIPEVQNLVGKRVVLHGMGTNVPVYDNHNRLRLLIEYHLIKAVLNEEELVSNHNCCCRG